MLNKKFLFLSYLFLFFVIATKCAENSLYDITTFRAVQRMHEIVKEEAIKAREYGVRSIELGKDCWPGAYHSFANTKSGLLLENWNTLCTPWGTVKLLGGGNYSWLADCALTQQISRRISSTFRLAVKFKYTGEKDRAAYHTLKSSETDLREHSLIDDPNDWSSYYDLCERLMNNLTQEDLESKKGQDLLVWGSFAGYYPIHNVHAVEDIELPEPVLYQEGEDVPSQDEIEAAWKLLENQYNS